METKNTKLFVRSLSFNTSDQELESTFAKIGNVKPNSAKVIRDRETGRSRGFAFIEMETVEEAKTAVQKLNGSTLDGRTIEVLIATDNNKNQPRNRNSGSAYRGNRSY